MGTLLPPSAEEETEFKALKISVQQLPVWLGRREARKEGSPLSKPLYTVTEKGLDGDSHIPVCQTLDQHRRDCPVNQNAGQICL